MLAPDNLNTRRARPAQKGASLVRVPLSLLASIAALALAACGSSASSSSTIPRTGPSPAPTVAPSPGPSLPPSNVARGTLSVHIPPRITAASAHARRPQWVSPSTDHAIVTVSTVGADGTTLTPYATNTLPVTTTGANPPCTTSASGTDCSWSVAAPIGRDDAKVDLFDNAARLLATNRLDGGNAYAAYISASSPASTATQFTMVSGSANHITLGTVGLFPVVASVTATAGCTYGILNPQTVVGCTPPTVGTSDTFSVSPTLLDVDGNVIASTAGVVLYQPVTIATSDPSSILIPGNPLASNITNLDPNGTGYGFDAAAQAPRLLWPSYGGAAGTVTWTFAVGGTTVGSATFTPAPAPMVLFHSETSSNLTDGGTLPLGNTDPTSASIIAGEVGFGGTFTETDTCAGIATVAHGAPYTLGFPATRHENFSVTMVAAGTCSMSFTDGNSTTTVSVVATAAASLGIH